MKKTNAIRLLELEKIEHDILTYDTSDDRIDGISVAQKINHNPEYVFKTLVTYGTSKNIYVFCIPVEYELDLKKAAKAVKEKKIEMLHVKELLKNTGYIRGGCSPIGMKKKYQTIIDETAELYDNIVLSAGAIGMQIMIRPDDLINIVDGEYKDII